MRKVVNPQKVEVVRMNGNPISEKVLQNTNAYLAAYVIITGVSFHEKLQAGPTISKPGPILLKQASTAEILVVMEKPSMEISRKLTPVMMTHWHDLVSICFSLVYSYRPMQETWAEEPLQTYFLCCRESSPDRDYDKRACYSTVYLYGGAAFSVHQRYCRHTAHQSRTHHSPPF